MTAKVYSLDTKPGIQRDGTVFDKQYYTDGEWVRFQRGRPRKMNGVREIVDDLAGICRGIYVNPQNGSNNVYSGYRDGLQLIPVNNNGVGSGITFITMNDFTPDDNNLWQFDIFTDSFGSGNTLLLSHPGRNLSSIDSTQNVPVLGGSVTGSSVAAIGVFTQTGTTASGSPTVTLATSNPNIGPGQLVTGSGIPSGATVVSVVGTALTLSANATANATVTLTFDNQISVSGGLIVLHPYVFVYGNDGLIKNCASGNLEDWVSAEANEVNVATGKIVKGLPVRGGSNSPSGLFWSLDSLIRVSYAPTTVVVGGTQVTQYWRYDIISSQTSILSSQCVIEYDGIYYWIGTDRFMLYNGVVKEIPNTFNQNYFFDNLNYSQRQKVWATKVPRFGEIWWYYPRGDSTECNDAIIYNIRENCWYDAGSAVHARRSAGFFSQVFRFPVAAGWDVNAVGGLDDVSISDPGSGYVDGTYQFVPVGGGSGTGATATVTVTGGVVTAFVVRNQGTNYAVGDVLTVDNTHLGGTGSDLAVTVGTTETFVSLWEHEVGVDAIRGPRQLAIRSFFETNDLGWVSGGPSEPAAVGANRWLDMERVEPDFILQGGMTMNVVSRPYAQSQDSVSQDYNFDASTNKIDLREQGRQLRLKFTSNEVGGDYQVGRILVNGYFGDVRGY